jgi:predicted component of type VI protein secretion system
MKLSLVVKGSGKQEGKVLAIPLAQFVIGRDPQCHLRPASPMISKRHCALLQRDGKAFVRDFDSTNGTFVNDQPVKGEVELKNDDTLKVGPLQFVVRIAAGAPVNRATPKPPTKDLTPKAAPAAAAPPAAKAPPASRTPPPPSAGGSASDDDVAAMLLSLQDDGEPGSPLAPGGEVPDGSTVLDLVVPPGADGAPADKNEKDKGKEKPKASGNTSSAAKSILEQYMKRPRA